MPRIDPYTLIRTLGLLLSPKGGIRTSEEVTRIVQLMQKFSKKMVSKCVYIQILKATKSEILENFMDKKGWDLLNSWLSEAVLTENWALCKELIKLFLESPVRASAIEENEALKLVKQLSFDIGVQEQVKELALKVQKKWMSLINPPEDPEDLTSSPSQNEGTETAGADVDLKSKKDSVDDRRKTEESLRAVAEEQTKSSKKEKGHKRKTNDDDDKGSRISFKKESERGKRNDKTKLKEHVGEKLEETKEKHRSEKKSKPYSRTELKDDLGDMERSRIKEKALKMKNDLASKKDSSKENSNVKNSNTSGLEKVQKIPKKSDKEKAETSFNDMLGAMDASKSKKTVKVAPSKNKNKGLMESLSSTNTSKPPHSKHKQVKSISSKYAQSNSSQGTITTTSTSSSSANKNKSDKSENGIVPEVKSDKRPIEMGHPVGKSKAGLKECDIFGNVLSTAMHDDLALNEYYPKKKKLKLSDVKGEKVASETPITEPDLEKKIDSFSFYGGGEVQTRDIRIENDTEKDCSSDQVSESDMIQTTSQISKEVSGILVISRGSKSAKRGVHWKSDEDLVQIEYFELDETERVNVNKVKFDTMRQREAAMEKEKFGTLTNKWPIEDEENTSNRIPWKLVDLVSAAPQEYGRDSQEKVTQAQRELGVLQAIIFNKKMSPEPSEPDFCVTPEADPTLVHFEDVDENSDMFAYSETGWCPGVDSRQKSQQSNGINSTVQPEKNQDSLVNHGLRIKSVDNALLAVEPNGQERLLPPSLYFEQVGEPLGPVSDNGTSHKSYYMDPNIQSPQENKMGPVTFYGNGMGEPSQENKVGSVTFYGNGMGESSQENKVGSVTFYGNGMGVPGNGCGPEPISCVFPVNGYGSAVNQADQGENNRFHEEVDQNSSWNRGQARGFSNRNRGNRGNNGRGGGGFRNNQNKSKDGISGGRGGK